MTPAEQASLNVARKIYDSDPANKQWTFAEFMRKLVAAIESDTETRETVAKGIQQELFVIQETNNPALSGGEPKNRVFNNLFGPLLDSRKPATDVSRSSGAVSDKVYTDVATPFRPRFIK
jgi:hypothetical protein